MTWRTPRRRLEVWLTHTESTFGSILGRTRRRPSKRGTNWKAGGKLSVWISASSTKWTARRAPLLRFPRNRQLPKSLPPQLRRKKKPVERPLARRPRNQADPQLRNLKPRPTEKWDYWSGFIFLHTKSFPSSGGSRGFLLKSRSKALLRKLLIMKTRNSRRPISNLSPTF